MRVFEQIWYNRKDIRFKDTADTVCALLQKYGISYKNIALYLDFDQTGEACETVAKLFPALNKYKKSCQSPYRGDPTYAITSVSQDDTGRVCLHVDKEDEQDVFALLRKIPRPVNFAFMGVLFDGVDWYGEEEQTGLFSPNHRGDIVPNHEFQTYRSNSILLTKKFDFGNKRNPVEVRIDRTDADGSLRPYPAAFEKFAAEMGKALGQNLECIFPEKEREALRAVSKALDGQIQQQNYGNLFQDFVLYDAPIPMKSIANHVMEVYRPVEGFSPKEIFGKIARKYGYRYVSFSNGLYTYQKINNSNHRFLVEMIFIPFSVALESFIRAEGYNFSHTFPSPERIIVKDAADAERYAEVVFGIAARTEGAFADTFLTHYGNTPDWYVQKK